MSTKLSGKTYKIVTITLAVFMVITLYPNTASAQYGGGSGGGSFIIMQAKTLDFSGQDVSAEFSVCEVYKIEFHLRQEATFTSTILCITQPVGISPAPQTTIQYYMMTVPQHIKELIQSFTIYIKIPKSVLEELDIDPNSIIMYRYNDSTSEWESLQTEKTGEDSSYVYYRVMGNRLSFLALTGQEVIPPSLPTPFSKTFSVEEFRVPVTLTSGEVKSVDANINGVSLELMLEKVDTDATLTVQVPRGLLDSKNPDGSDRAFSILADGMHVDYTETTEDGKRILKINIPANTSKVSIIGTSIVPEFGVIAFIVLAASITGVIVLMRSNIKYRL